MPNTETRKWLHKCELFHIIGQVDLTVSSSILRIGPDCWHINNINLHIKDFCVDAVLKSLLNRGTTARPWPIYLPNWFTLRSTTDLKMSMTVSDSLLHAKLGRHMIYIKYLPTNASHRNTENHKVYIHRFISFFHGRLSKSTIDIIWLIKLLSWKKINDQFSKPENGCKKCYCEHIWFILYVISRISST